MYVDLGDLETGQEGAVRATTIEQIIDRANEILHPYRLDVKNVAWHSVYEVGHRLTSRFDDVPPEQLGTRMPRVFIAGDACHTHSAKAGQGMNVSMQDGFNIGWKLGHVLDGRAPEALLANYSAERQVIAQNLIDFDREWSTLMAKRPEEFDDPSELERFYVDTAEFPAGFMTQYAPSIVVGDDAHQDARHRVPDRQAVPLGPGDPGVRRQPRAPGTPGPRRRAVADLRLRAHPFGGGRRAPRRLLGLADRRAGLPPRRDPRRRRPRRLVRRQGDLPGRTTPGSTCSTVPEAFRPRVGPFELVDLEKVYATEPGERHLRAARHRRATASWSSCAPISTSRTCCRCRRPSGWPTSSAHSWRPKQEQDDGASSERADPMRDDGTIEALLGRRPGKVIAVHVNYPSRAAERGRTPSQPSYFLKPSTLVVDERHGRRAARRCGAPRVRGRDRPGHRNDRSPCQRRRTPGGTSPA